MSERLVSRWEAVYEEYGMASQRLSSSEPGDRTVARQMARASADVAAVWREMAGEPDLPWWSVAALSAAAQAFEYQARDWSARAQHMNGGLARRLHPQVDPPTRELAGDGSGPGTWSQ